MFEEFSDQMEYKVVINHEEQYSLWPAGRENPLGWKDAGRTGTKKACLTYIEEVWTDLRPLSVHSEMASELLRRR
jgi:MbtH protein